jgi:hypothetical protein
MFRDAPKPPRSSMDRLATNAFVEAEVADVAAAVEDILAVRLVVTAELIAPFRLARFR